MRLNLRLKKVLATTAAATIMATALPVVTYAADYDNHWAKEAITKWSEKEVLEGYEDGTFKPNNKVTRGELAAIIVRVFGLTDTSAAEKYTDVEATKWYASDIAKVSSAGIMNDYEDGTFKPNQEATREEAAYAIAKAYKVAAKETNVTFKDQAQISDWAEAEIASLVAGGYLNGNPDGTFRPTASLTRAEAVTMVDKITADLVNVAGTYSQDTDGHLVVNTTGVELKDMVITGNLYLAEGIGEGEVKLDNVTVLGDIIVEGGSVNTISIIGKSKVNNILVDKAGEKAVRLLMGNLVEVAGTVTLNSDTVVEGNKVALKKVVINGAKNVEFVGKLQIEQVEIKQTTKLILVDGPVINELVVRKEAQNTVLGGRGERGKIKTIIVEADGLKINRGFNYDKLVIAEGVNVKPALPSSGGGGSSSNGGSDNRPNPPVETDDPINVSVIEVKLVNQEAPVQLKVANKRIDIVVDSKADNNQGAILVNGHEFKRTDEIETIQAIEDHGIEELTVGLTGKYQVTLKPGKAYTVADLKAEVKAKESLAYDLLDEVAEKASLTPEQKAKAEKYLTKAFTRLDAYTGTTVKVGDLIDAANDARSKVDEEDIQKIYNKFKDIFGDYNVMVNIDNTLSVEGKLFVEATDKHETDHVRISVTYK